MAKVKQSFGVQAAKFGLYAPIMAFVIIILSAGNRELPRGAIAVGCINAVLIVAGFFLSITALAMMGKYGRQGILGRAIGGLLLSGGVLAASLYVLLPVMFSGPLRDQIAGHWRLISSPGMKGQKIDITFHPNGTFDFSSVDARSNPRQLDGKWVLDSRSKLLEIDIDPRFSNGPGKIRLGIIKEIDDKHMVLTTDKGTEGYGRIVDNAQPPTTAPTQPATTAPTN